jgi:peroxiredoxin Q/BCP
VQVNDPAPVIKAMDQDGNPWVLSDHLGGKYLVVYFYPAAMTGGCTKQACAYRDYKKEASDLGFEVVGISADPVQNLKYFQTAERLNFTLLSDPDGAIAEAYGVPVRTGDKSIERTVDGKPVALHRSSTISRWTFIIDPQGKLVYRAEKVKPVEDLENVLAFLRQAGQ